MIAAASCFLQAAPAPADRAGRAMCFKAIGLAEPQAKSSIRLGFGRYTTAEDIESAAATINAAAREQGL